MVYAKQATALKYFVEKVQNTPKFPLRLDLQFFSDGGSGDDPNKNLEIPMIHQKLLRKRS